MNTITAPLVSFSRISFGGKETNFFPLPLSLLLSALLLVDPRVIPHTTNHATEEEGNQAVFFAACCCCCCLRQQQSKAAFFPRLARGSFLLFWREY